MEELGKIVRVIGRELPGAPHETLLVLDANTGQNAISQARLFTEVAARHGHRAHQARRHREGRRDRRPRRRVRHPGTLRRRRRGRRATSASSAPTDFVEALFSARTRGRRMARYVHGARPGHDLVARDPVRRAGARRRRSTSTSSASTSRSPAGSSTIPRRSWRRSSAPRAARSPTPGRRASDVAAIGITNQRETTVVWERAQRAADPSARSSGSRARPRRSARSCAAAGLERGGARAHRPRDRRLLLGDEAALHPRRGARRAGSAPSAASSPSGRSTPGCSTG